MAGLALSADNGMARFLNSSSERFANGEETLESIAAQFSARYPDSEFPFDFALKLEQRGIPQRYITDTEMQCVKDDLETLVNAFRKSYVFGGINRSRLYTLIESLRELAAESYTGIEEGELKRIGNEAQSFIAQQPPLQDANAFFDLYREHFAKGIYEGRRLFVEFKEAFPGCTASFEFFDYELADVLGGKAARSPRQIVRTREQSQIFDKLEERGAFYVIEYFSLKPEFIPDVLVAMYPEMAMDKEALKKMFSPALPDSDEARNLRHYLGVCRRQRADAIGAYDGRRDLLKNLSDLAARIFQNAHRAEEVVTRILVDVVRADYDDLFRQDRAAVFAELNEAMAGAEHEYARVVVARVSEYYHRLDSAKLLGIRPVITVK